MVYLFVCLFFSYKGRCKLLSMAAEHVLLRIENIEEAILILVLFEHLLQALVCLHDFFALVNHQE